MIRKSKKKSLAGKMFELGAVSHLDPSHAAVDSGSVSTWGDRLLNGHSLQSASPSTRLVYSASIPGLGGRPGWTSDGARYLLSTSNAMAALFSGLAPFSVYIVRRASIAADSIVACIGDSVGGDYNYFGALGGASSVSALVRNQAGQTAHIGSVANTTMPVIESYLFTGSSVAVWANGQQSVPSAPNAKMISVDRACIGGLYQAGVFSLGFAGEIGDIITFPVAHSDETRHRVQGLLSEHYAVTVQ